MYEYIVILEDYVLTHVDKEQRERQRKVTKGKK
jgi:hypothetical protein